MRSSMSSLATQKIQSQPGLEETLSLKTKQNIGVRDQMLLACAYVHNGDKLPECIPCMVPMCDYCLN